MLQDQAQCILGDYVRNRYQRQPTRFGRLLLAIPLLRMIRTSTIEMIFFKDTVGEASVIRLLHDMYTANNVNSQSTAYDSSISRILPAHSLSLQPTPSMAISPLSSIISANTLKRSLSSLPEDRIDHSDETALTDNVESATKSISPLALAN